MTQTGRLERPAGLLRRLSDELIGARGAVVHRQRRVVSKEQTTVLISRNAATSCSI
jgi:hypothetical protein